MPRFGADEDSATVGARLRLRRKALGLKQHDVAAAIGVTYQQVQKYEKGTNRLSCYACVKLAELLQCSVAELLGENADHEAVPPAVMATDGAVELVETYGRIKSRAGRRALLQMARVLVEGFPPDSTN